MKMPDTEFDIKKNLAKLRFILASLKNEKPIKPKRRRVSKKYKKIQEHYLQIIEDLNQKREALKLSLQCNIEIIEMVLAYKQKEITNAELKKQVNEQRELNLQLYKAFSELEIIMRNAIQPPT